MAIAIGVLFAGAASARALVGLEKVSYDGSLEVKGISANNEIERNDKSQNSDHRGETNTRVRLGINATVTEGVMGRVEFGRTGSQYGQSLPAGSAAGASNDLNTEQSNILVNNAYVDLSSDIIWLNARLGRQYVGNANDLVWFIGPRQGDAMAINAIDGINLSKKWDMVEVNLFGGKALKNGTQGTTDEGGSAGSVNLNSYDVVIPKLVPTAKINLGYLWGSKTSVSGATDRLSIWRAGIAGGVMDNMITYKAEYLQNGGEDKIDNVPGGQTKVKYEGSAVDLGVGYNSPETPAGKFAGNIGYLSASGDSKTGDNKDKSFHDFSALGVASSDRYYGQIGSKSDAVGSGLGRVGANSGAQGVGLKVLNVGVEYLPKMVEKASVRIDYFDFKASEDGNNSAAPKAGDIATEWDLTLGYKATDNVGLSAGYATLKPDKGIVGIVPGTKKDAVKEFFANATIKWGAAE